MRKNPSTVLLALGGFAAMAAGIGIGRFVYTPILPPMQEAVGFGKTAAGLIASANFAGYLLGALAVTGARLPGSRRAWLLGALVLSGVTTAAMAVSSSLLLFALLRCIGGIASAWALILSSSLVLDRLAASGRPGLAALHFAGVGIGMAASGAIVASLLSLGFGWRAMWLASGGLSLAGTLAVALLVPAGGDAPPAKSATRESPDPRLRRMTLAYGLFGFGYVITATFLVAIVRATPAVRPLEPAIWVIAGLAAAPSVMLWTAIGRRFGVATGFAAAALTEAAGVLSAVAWPTAAGICLAAILVGGTFMGLTAMGLMRARELARGDTRRVMATMTGAFGIGQIVGPALAGFVSDRAGGFALPSAAAAAALVLAAFLARYRSTTSSS